MNKPIDRMTCFCVGRSDGYCSLERQHAAFDEIEKIKREIAETASGNNAVIIGYGSKP